MAEFVIITGMSGAGRSTVSNAFEDLGWFVIDNMPLRLVGKVAELVEGPNATIEKVRARKDVALEKGKGTVQKIPFMLMNWFLKLIGLLMYTFNIDLSFVGMPKDAFGSLTVTNVGSLGLDTAYVPLVPYTHVPIFVAPGLVKDVPVVEDGKVIPGKVMNINASFDHRFIDGYHASVLSKTLREMMENPFECFDRLDTLSAVSAPAATTA